MPCRRSVPTPVSAPTPSLSRRYLLVAGLSASTLMIGRSAAVLADTTTAEDLLTRFLQWSRVATGFPELDVAIARECLELHLRSGTAPADLHALDPARYRGTEFERRLLEVWYTGVFRPDVSPNGRNDTTTLMWRAAGSGPPGQCKGSPDSWATAPDPGGAAVG